MIQLIVAYQAASSLHMLTKHRSTAGAAGPAIEWGLSSAAAAV